MMKKVMIVLSALLFSANSFANIDVNQIHSAIQNGFNNSSLVSQNSVSITYGGKDISRPKVAIADEKNISKIIC
ncbi:MAG: hypothetical protein JO131_06115 [Gammaproteobacteria bacterium]|nr:hypothetical protein [Gammaproteobacteria bacterium]